MKKSLYSALFGALLTIANLTVIAQEISTRDLDHWVADRISWGLNEHRELVRIPNISLNEENMRKNAEWLAAAFGRRSFQAEVLETGSIPVVFASLTTDPDLPTVLFYLHYDGQAVDPTQWDQEDPFEPEIRRPDSDGWTKVPYLDIDGWDPEWRVYGRSAADDKGPIIMFLQAIDLLNSQGIKPAFNIKVMLDGEEEAGSDGLKATLDTYRDKYKADRLIIMDGPAHPSNRPTLTFGCRGSTSAILKVYGARTPQHSGHFGNYAPNPAFSLSKLLSSMKDEQGRVLIEGFYDGIELSKKTKEVLESVPDDEEMILKRLGISEAEKVGEGYQESLQYPSLNIKGMASGWIGDQTRTIIPDKAEAVIGIRLVVESDGERLLQLVEEHIRNQGYYLTEGEPTDEERAKYPRIASFNISRSVTPAFRTELDSPMGLWLSGALEDAFGEAPVRIRTMGGTVPVTPIIKGLDIPAIILPLVNMDNNQHSPNENLRVGNMYTGIKAIAAILSQPF